VENKPSARIITLGCRLNHADSALLAGRLQSAGYTLTDDSSAVERMGMSVKIVEGDERNIKVTTPLDLAVARLLLEEEI